MRALLRKSSTGAILGTLLFTALSPACFTAQQKISKEPVQVVDAATGKLIPELLVIPRYSSFKGVSTLFGEGPGRGVNRDYLAKPFVYHTKDPFKPKQPKVVGVFIPGLIFTGKGVSLEGVLVIAPGYRPRWFTSLWEAGAERKLQLTPMSVDESSALLGEKLSPLERGARRVNDDCSFWDLPTPCDLEIRFNKKERELVRSFLQQARTGT
jgi:hypothetical protein